MLSSRFAHGVLAAVLVVVSLACSAPPDKELHQAEGAIETARAAGAPRYASGEFGAAEAALARAREFVNSRDYRQALNHALDARERAIESTRVAAGERARVRSTIEQHLADLETAYRQLVATLEGPDVVKALRPATLTSARQHAQRVQTTIAHARSQLDAGDDDQAATALEPLGQLMTTTRSEIDAAIAARQVRRPPRRSRR